MMQPLLVELLTEELPPKALVSLSQAFGEGIFNRLKEAHLLGETATFKTYATPRRLAVLIEEVSERSPIQKRREKILPVNIALDKVGEPTLALSKKLMAMGLAHLSISQLERSHDGKVESFFYSYDAPGISLQEALQVALENTLTALPIPTLMTYQIASGKTVQFVRPAHRLVALHGSHIVPVHCLGLSADRITEGHRFLSSTPFSLTHANDYEEKLHEHKVIVNFHTRQEIIRKQLKEKAGENTVLMDHALLEEVTALVEWPIVYTCTFEAHFLSVPQECLILTMQTNQKYFALTDTNKTLRPSFLVVSNIDTPTPQYIIRGNEMVIRPRLSDAQFFFTQDKKQSLAARVPLLKEVRYHNKLGTQYARMERIQCLTTKIAHMLGLNQESIKHGERAAYLAKADLLTQMVAEFPQLQGVMGRYYAEHDHEPLAVQEAIAEHYYPRFAGDVLPEKTISIVLALADKLETLVGMWGIGLEPKGEGDPFALRRCAVGILRILVEKKLPLDLFQLIDAAQALFDNTPHFVRPGESFHDFMYERLRGLLKDRQRFTQAQIEAVLALRPRCLFDIISKLEAVQYFSTLPESAALASANKRIHNILKKIAHPPSVVNRSLLEEPAEKVLFEATHILAKKVQQALDQHHFKEALSLLATIGTQVDAFFNHVMVMTENDALRMNRIALLKQLHCQLNQVADIAQLAH